MDRQTPLGTTPWRYVLEAHPPWVHWSFWMVWRITASLGPIACVVGLLARSGTWWVGVAIYGVALVTITVDWVILRRRRQDPAWIPWQPPRWSP